MMTTGRDGSETSPGTAHIGSTHPGSAGVAGRDVATHAAGSDGSSTGAGALDGALADAFWPDRRHLERLGGAFAARAEADGLVDVAVRQLDSPVGSLLLAATVDGIVRVAFEYEDHDEVLDALARTVSPRILVAPARTDAAARQLDEYFAGRRRRFELSLDLRLVSGFRREVLERLREIPYGRTASYAEVAATVGRPKAFRAVGSACSHNPVPLLVPCHRVVHADGRVGAYLGSTETKRALLALESA